MDKGRYTVILVYSTSHALKAEKVLHHSEIVCKLIPVPRHFSSDCGSCVRILRDDKERVLQVLKEAHIEIAGVHDLKPNMS